MCCHQRKMHVLRVEAGQMLLIILAMKLDFQGEEWTHHNYHHGRFENGVKLLLWKKPTNIAPDNFFIPFS